jgi:DNA-binding NarL/FixJ family response regulator
MLVDDHASMRDGIRAFLSMESNLQIVGEAENGHQAIKRIADLIPDIVIMDVGMPQLNGIETTRQIRKHDPKIKIIALTRHDDALTVNAMIQAGCKGYILKTQPLREVKKAIALIQHGQCYFSPEIAHMITPAPKPVHHVESEPAPTQNVTSKEKQILQLLAEGLSNKEIATHLNMSIKTVETHRGHLMNKLNLHNVASLTRYAIRHGITEL